MSIILNIAYFKFDTFDYYFIPKIKKYTSEKKIKKIDHNTEMQIINKALDMLKSNKPIMIWEKSYGIHNKLFKPSSSKSLNFKIFNYPKAYLSVGLAEYATKKNKIDLIKQIELFFQKIMTKNGIPNFNLDKIDQVPYGLAALKLYQFTLNEKYLSFSNSVYEYILQNINEEGMIDYRPNSSGYLNDTLGLVIPFLIEYYRITKIDRVILIARNQIDFFIQRNGINKDTFIPVHGIKKKTNVQVGSVNWGRGIGWYIIAISHIYKETGEFKKELNGLINTLSTLKNSEGLWSQFPGSSDVFDASATMMILYSIKKVDPEIYPKKEFLEKIKKYLAIDGSILNTSGDTKSLNNYSDTFGKSELSQGMLLLILALE